MAGYPNLHPSGFLEHQESCDGPRLYRGQPSRETGGVTLNEFMTKYNPSTSVTDYKFLETIRNLKEFSRNWKNIPKHTRKEIIATLNMSDNDMAKDLNNLENFTNVLKEAKSSDEAKNIVNNMIEHFANDKDLKCVNESQSIWITVIVAIVAIVISFLIFWLGQNN